jgi:quercetin dioxygenase-like cupin family protein
MPDSKKEIRLSTHNARKLPAKTQQLEIKRGQAWVSLGQEDIVLKPGEAVTLHADDHGAVISAAGRGSMVFSVDDIDFDSDVPPSQRLGAREAKRLENKTQVIEVQRGKAWVSLDDEDIVLQPGESVTIRAARHSGVISATGRGSMVFTVREED